MAKNLLDNNRVEYQPNYEGERLKAAGEHELQVCGVLQLNGTYNGSTAIMECLVTPDLDNETIVSAADAEAVGAITRNRADSNQSAPSNKLANVNKCKRKKRVQFNVEDKEIPPTTPARDSPSAETGPAWDSPSADTSNNRRDPPSKNKAGDSPLKQTTKEPPISILRREEPATTSKNATYRQENPAQSGTGDPPRKQTAKEPPSPKIRRENPAPASKNAAPRQENPAANNDMFARAYNNTTDPNHPKVKSLTPEEARFKAMIKLLCETYSCLSDTLPEDPMDGPPMVINLRDDPSHLPKKAYKHIPMPLHFKIPGNQELDRLIREGIIRQIQHSASGPFCARAFFVIKPGSQEEGEMKLRLVTDFSEVNKLVIRPVHPFTPGPELLKAIPHTAKFFAKVDFLKGFYQIPLSPCSQNATSFICERGTFVYLRAPMGLNASGDEFCRRSDDALIGLQGIVKLIDDVLVFAETEDQLYERLEAVIQRCQDTGITLSMNKIDIGRQMNFAGFHISEEGRRPTEERMAAIKNFPTPTDRTSAKSFAGLANQVGEFHPDVAHATAAITELTKKDNFYWDEDLERSFQVAKNILSGPSCLKHFNPNWFTSLIVDASRIGLGFVLVQQQNKDKKPFVMIQCGSRKVSPTESRYAICELETLAVTWSIRKCRHYLAGMPHFRVLTDHSSLTKTFRKDLCDVENIRQFRFRESVLSYNFDVDWVEGKRNDMADALSRFPVFPAEDENEEPCVCRAVRTMEKREDPLLAPLILAANQDKEYSLMRQMILEGTKFPADHEYKSIETTLSVEPCNLVVKDTKRIIVPKACQDDILNTLHLAHCGEGKTTLRANLHYHWTGMTPKIKEVVLACPQCRKARSSQQQQPIVQYNQAEAPMEVIGMDLFHSGGKEFLVVVDQFSSFPMVAKLPTTNTATVLRILLEWFQLLGFPEKIISDGGPQFRSAFKAFCKEHAIHHDPASAYHPAGNGLAEAAVKRTKGLLGKLGNNWPEFMMALCEYRNTPTADAGASPAQQFLGRRQRTKLPMLPGQTKLEIWAANKAAETKKERRAQQYATRRTKDLPPLKVGQHVIIQTPEGWNASATVLDSSHGDRSYSLQMADGSTKRLNRQILMPVPEKPDNEATVETDHVPLPENAPIQEIADGADVTQDSIHTTRTPDRPASINEAESSAPTLRRSSRKHTVGRKCTCCEVLHCKILRTEKDSVTIFI